MNHETEYSALLGLLAACNRHLETPNAKLFAAAILEAEAAIGESPRPAPAITATAKLATPTALRRYDGEDWPKHWPNPDAILTACIGGAREGKIRAQVGCGQFAARHALKRLEAEGWVKADLATGSSRVWHPLAPAISALSAKPPLTVAALRSLHATCEEESSYLEDWVENALGPEFPHYSTSEIAAFVVQNLDSIMAGCSTIARGDKKVFWLPKAAENSAEAKKEECFEEIIEDV